MNPSNPAEHPPQNSNTISQQSSGQILDRGNWLRRLPKPWYIKLLGVLCFALVLLFPLRSVLLDIAYGPRTYYSGASVSDLVILGIQGIFFFIVPIIIGLVILWSSDRWIRKRFGIELMLFGVALTVSVFYVAGHSARVSAEVITKARAAYQAQTKAEFAAEKEAFSQNQDSYYLLSNTYRDPNGDTFTLTARTFTDNELDSYYNGAGPNASADVSEYPAPDSNLLCNVGPDSTPCQTITSANGTALCTVVYSRLDCVMRSPNGHEIWIKVYGQNDSDTLSISAQHVIDSLTLTKHQNIVLIPLVPIQGN